MTEEEFNNRLKMYVLIRKDILTDVQCGVQAGHAIASYMSEHIKDEPKLVDWVDNHKTLIYLAASEEQIEEKKKLLSNWVGFNEADLDGIETAVAFVPISNLEGRFIFGDLKLI